MTNPTGKGGFQKGQSGNPGGRSKLPADIREAFKAKAPQALEVLTRCLQSGDDRIAMMAAQAILDRGYGKPTQSIDAMMIRFATSSNCPRSLQRRRNGWRTSGGRMPGERWSPASLLPSMTSQRIRRRWVPSYPTPGIDRGKYRYPSNVVPDSLHPGLCSLDMF